MKIKKYRLLFIWRFLGWGVALLHLAFAIIALVFLNRLFLRLPLLMIPYAGYIILIFYSLIRGLQVRLELSNNGIYYDSGSYIINTSWNNVERIGKGVPGLNIPVDGLVLRTPSAIKRSLVASIFWSGRMGKDDIHYAQFIPLQGLWSWNWRKSEMAEDLKHHLPHLF